MAAETTAKVEDVNGNGDYQRLYVGKSLAGDSAWPFRVGQQVRLQIVETTCGRPVVVAVPAVLEVDDELTDLEIARTTKDVQVSLEMEELEDFDDVEDVDERVES